MLRHLLQSEDLFECVAGVRALLANLLEEIERYRVISRGRVEERCARQQPARSRDLCRCALLELLFRVDLGDHDGFLGCGKLPERVESVGVATDVYAQGRAPDERRVREHARCLVEDLMREQIAKWRGARRIG